MEVGVWCGAGILVLYNIVLQIKVYLLRKSAKEIRKAGRRENGPG